VVVLEARQVGWAASGRNGGFCSASLTHGFGNGLSRFEPELGTLVRLGMENLDAIEETLRRYQIDAEFERTGGLDVATAAWQAEHFDDEPDLQARYGAEVEVLDRAAVQAMVHSPTYEAGLLDRRGTALVHPAKLAWGLKAACQQLGVRFFENTPVTGLRSDATGVKLATSYGSVRVPRVALATNAFPSLVRRARSYVVPVWDYALMTEPLSEQQRAAIGWGGRQGIGDASNQFHYYRQTADHRILWGGYDAVYYFGNDMDAKREHRAQTYATLVGNFFRTFPQLEGLRFSHRWGGAIDTCSRFTAFWGTAHQGRVGYVLGYTGLGVGATRFGARVMLDLINGRDTEVTRLQMVGSKPIPFPPEPLRSAGIGLTRWSIARADAHHGRRNLWLRTLDRMGLGFDS
jgi:glycine/D-amino acid oxidase-like deaminating enzyme